MCTTKNTVGWLGICFKTAETAPVLSEKRPVVSSDSSVGCGNLFCQNYLLSIHSKKWIFKDYSFGLLFPLDITIKAASGLTILSGMVMHKKCHLNLQDT